MFYKLLKHSKFNKGNEQGNVLFLILIAVALFAALSYAVTSSSRSGGGDVNNETNLVSSSSVIQYPASVQTAIMRMRINNNIDVAELEFYEPADFADCLSIASCVFHPQGGGATWANAPSDVMTGTGLNPTGRWHYSGSFEVENVGTSVSSSGDGNDIMMFLVGVKESICEKINKELGLGTVLPIGHDEYLSEEIITDSNFEIAVGSGYPYIPATREHEISNALFTGADVIDGSYNACYYEPIHDEYVFYSVLVAR